MVVTSKNSNVELARRVSETHAAALAIMTTDTHPKTASASAGAATLVGIAKGSGMIEPDMATMISVITTDAEIDPDRVRIRFGDQEVYPTPARSSCAPSPARTP